MRNGNQRENSVDRRNPANPLRSSASSRSSRKTATPLPQIQGTHSATRQNSATSRGHNSMHSMQELQHIVKLREQSHVHSSYSGHRLNDVTHMPATKKSGKDCTGKREEKKRKRKEMMGIAEAHERMTELGRGRPTLEGGKATLPSIGHERTAAKQPKLKPKLTAQNNAVDIISRHEASVKVTSKLKEISNEYMHETAKTFTTGHTNTAPEVISKYEDSVGRAYHGMSYDEYAEFYETRARSRCWSEASGRSD